LLQEPNEIITSTQDNDDYDTLSEEESSSDQSKRNVVFTLSEHILNKEIAKIEKLIDTELEDETNLTLSMMWQELGYDKALCEDLLIELYIYMIDSLVELAIKIFSIPPSQAKLLEYDLRDSVNGSTINASQIKFVKQSEKSSDSFEPIFGSCDMQLDEANNINLLIDEIINLSNLAFNSNNNLFIESQSIASNKNTQ
ncbi:22476_t:CDS:2, partial [Gigaspora margarita]